MMQRARLQDNRMVKPDRAHIVAMREVLLASDTDRVARHLGLANAEAAAVLLANSAALDRLSERLADGTRGLDLGEARTLVSTWLSGERTGDDNG